MAGVILERGIGETVVIQVDDGPGGVPRWAEVTLLDHGPLGATIQIVAPRDRRIVRKEALVREALSRPRHEDDDGDDDYHPDMARCERD